MKAFGNPRKNVKRLLPNCSCIEYNANQDKIKTIRPNNDMIKTRLF